MQVAHVRIVRQMLLGLIVVVLAAVGFNYVQTFRNRAKLVRQTAKILSSEMLRAADSIEYTENEDGVTRFKLTAQRLLETRQGKSLLEGIDASDKNPDGTTRNHIRSRKADYDRDGRKAFFYDDVRIEMSQGAVIRTNSLRYDLQSNVGETDDKLALTSRQVHGFARGIHYDHDKKELSLKADVDLTLERAVKNQDGSTQTETLHSRSKRGYYSDDGRVIRWEGEAQIESDTATLLGDEIEATFTEDKKRITSLFCRGNSVYRSRDPSENRMLQGDRMDFGINQETGNLERIDVHGHAAFTTRSPDGAESPDGEMRSGSRSRPAVKENSLTAGTETQAKTATAASVADTDSEQVLRGAVIHVELDPVENLPTSIRAEESVEFRNKRGADETTVLGDRLEASFISKSTLLERMRVWGHAHMTSRNSSDSGSDDLQADEIGFAFRDLQGRNALQRLDADGSVKWVSTPGAKPGQKATGSIRSLTSATLQMIYASAGDFLDKGRATGDVVLTGIPASGATRVELRRMKADEVRFLFYPGENKVRTIEGDGHVNVLYSRPSTTGQEGVNEESRTSSTNLKATFRESDGGADNVSQWGNFVFQDGTRTATSGRSDYSADKDLLILRESPRISDANGTTTGEVVTYDRKAKLLLVRSKVRSVLSQKESGEGTPFGPASGSSSASVVTADEMRYWTEDARIRYDDNVQMLSENGQLQTKTLEIFDSGARIEAQGDIRHLLPKSAMAQDSKGGAKARGKKGSDARPARSSTAPVLIRSAALRYFKTENSVHYTGGVTLESDDLWMASDTMDAVFEADGRRIEQAAARGHVHIRQGEREVKGTMGDYYLNPGKFVVLGEMAEITDPEKGKSAARRLTFFTSDDRILLENR